MSKEPRKKNVRDLDEDDLFGDFKSINEFIESDNFEVTTDNKKVPGKFEITANDQRKRPGHAAEPKKKNVEQLREQDLFGNFKPIDEYIESDSFEVTRLEGTRTAPRADTKTSRNVAKLNEDDLFGDFKPLDEFIESDSFEVTSPKKNQPLNNPTQSFSSIGPTSPVPLALSTSGPIPPPIPPISSPTGFPPSPPTISPGPAIVQPPSIGADSSIAPLVSQPEPMDGTKLKLAEIAKRRKGQKDSKSSKKGDIDGLFDDLDPLELDDY